MSVSVEIRRNDFPRIAGRFEPAVAEITQLAVFKVHEAADPNTPRNNGDLANNVVDGPDFVHWLMLYAGFQDKGTVFMPGTFFATNAANLVFPQWVQALSQIEGRL